MNFLNTRLFLAFFITISVIGLTGGVGVWFLKNHITNHNQIISRDFESIRMINDFRIMTADLESRYVNRLGDEGPVTMADDETLVEIRQTFDRDMERLAELAKSDSFSGQERAAVSNLAVATRKYLEEFDHIFEMDIHSVGREERVQLKARVLEKSYQMVLEVDNALDLLEDSFAIENQDAIVSTEKTIIALLLVSWLAVAMNGLAFLAFSKKIVNPLAELTDSIRAVQQQNFEQIIPVYSSDEVGTLAAAFNDMSAELRVMKLQTDQELMRLNQERSAIIDGFPHPIFILDENGYLSQSNPAARSLMEGVETNFSLPPKIRSRVDDCIRDDVEYLPEDIGEAILLRIAEREFWYLPRIFHVQSSGLRDFVGWSVVLMDVTRVRWLDELKTDMIGTISHEIKTPLTSIRMILHLLTEQKTGELNARQEKMAVSARDECERLIETLDNLLQLSRMDGGHHGLTLEPASPVELLETAIKSFSSNTNVHCVVDENIPMNLPYVLADHHRIGQVLTNFLSNAVKHSPPNANVKLSATSSDGKFVRFSVIDEGEGVPESEQDRIFERFYRQENQHSDGTGLGLWISREIVRAHGGKIGVVSFPGQLTEFFFELPLSAS